MAADDLGFWYCVYQPHPDRERVRVWLDGEELYTFYNFSTFLKFVESSVNDDLNSELLPLAKASLRETSFFFWDVAKQSLRRLTAVSSQDPYKVLVEEKKRAEAEAAASGNMVSDLYWRQSIDDSPDSNDPVKIKVR